MKVSAVYLIAGGAVGLALVWAMTRSGGVAGLAQSIGGAAVDAVDGVVSGAVIGIGAQVGIPATSRTQCEIDKANGDTWEASFSCPATDFIRYVWS